MRTIDPQIFGKVAVIMGGASSEREISLLTGQAVLNGLLQAQIDAHAVEVNNNLIQPILDGNFDRVFIALHGRGGEDGVIQGALTAANIPYTGSGILASALAMDKLRTKQLWNSIGLLTPASRALSSDEQITLRDAEGIFLKLGSVVFVKPSLEGSSVGMSRVDKPQDLLEACLLAQKYQCPVLIESFVKGQEFTVAILNGRALPSIQLQTPRTFYDYQAKYQSDNTIYRCPSGLNEQDETALGELAVAAYNSVGCKGWGRVDVMRNEKGEWFLLEVNTVPGMTTKSLVPMAAKQAGISFSQLAVEILLSSLEPRANG